MIVLVLADPHANLAALDAVLAEAGRRASVDQVWCLGDVVGYGPEPAACVARIREVADRCVAGNHDLAAAGLLGTEDFNRAASVAAEWTTARLGEAEAQYLLSLPLVDAGSADQDFTLVHGSLRDPVWEYLLSAQQAEDQFAQMQTRHAAVGHSHVPFIAEQAAGGRASLRALSDGRAVEFGDRRVILNPGGCGQPRDGDPRAAYLLLDTTSGTARLHRVEYDIAGTQRLMAAAGLPSSLIERLAHGR